jgi:hypothetical protein
MQFIERFCDNWSGHGVYTPNEIMFPAYVIPQLRNLRGPEWQALIDRLLELPETHEEVLAFMLMMIRINGCMECETDSYRAMRGCDACAIQTLRRNKTPDAELMAAYQAALQDVQEYIARTGHNSVQALLESI